MSIQTWLRRTDWLWMIIGGFYLIAYLYWYIPALKELPHSVRDPPSPFPWHWTLDFLATGIAGGTLLYLGFSRATELTAGPDSNADEDKNTPTTTDSPT